MIEPLSTQKQFFHKWNFDLELLLSLDCFDILFISANKMWQSSHEKIWFRQKYKGVLDNSQKILKFKNFFMKKLATCGRGFKCL